MSNYKSYLLGIIGFTFFIMAGMSIISDLVVQDPSFAQDGQVAAFNSSFNVMNDLNTQVGGLTNSVTNSSQDLNIPGATIVTSLFGTAWQTLKTMLTSLSFMNSVFNGLTTVFGIPAWIPSLIIMAISVILIFSVLSAIFQHEV